MTDDKELVLKFRVKEEELLGRHEEKSTGMQRVLLRLFVESLVWKFQSFPKAKDYSREHLTCISITALGSCSMASLEKSY